MDNTEPASDRQDDLKALRRKNRLIQEQLRADALAEAAKRAEHDKKARRMREAYQSDWVDPWLTAMTASRNAFAPIGPATMWQRRKGQNYPVYRTEQDLALLRFPSRWLCSTNSYAIGFVGGLTGYMLGSGLTYRVVPKDKDDASSADLVAALQEVVDDTLELNEWYGGECPGFEEEYFQRSIEDGEAIATHWVTGNGVEFRFADPEQLTEPADLVSVNDRPYELGVKVDPKDVEKPLEYVIAYNDAKTEYDLLPAEKVTHLRRNAKRSMKRGVPDISFQTYEALDQAAKVMENSGESAAQQAAIVAVMSFKTGTQSEIQAVATGANDYYEFDPYSGQEVGVKKARRGTTEYVPDSQQYTKGPAASNAAAHMQIQMELLRCAGVRWNAPDWLITGNASGNTFSNAGQVASSFCNTIIRQQRRYTAAFRRMIWYAVEQRVRAGAVSGRSWEDIVKAVDLMVEAPNPIMPDPLADAQVAAIEIPMGVQSRQAYMQEKGRDSKQIEADNAAWQAEHGEDMTGDEAGSMMGEGDDDANDDKVRQAAMKNRGDGTPDDVKRALTEQFDESKHPRVSSGEHGGEFGKGGGVANTKKERKKVSKELKSDANGDLDDHIRGTGKYLQKVSLKDIKAGIAEDSPSYIYEQTQKKFKAKGIAQKDLSRAMYLSPDDLNKYIGGETINMDQFSSWAEDDDAAMGFIKNTNRGDRVTVLMTAYDVPIENILASHDTWPNFQKIADENQFENEKENLAAIGQQKISLMYFDDVEVKTKDELVKKAKDNPRGVVRLDFAF